MGASLNSGLVELLFDSQRTSLHLVQYGVLRFSISFSWWQTLVLP